MRRSATMWFSDVMSMDDARWCGVEMMCLSVRLGVRRVVEPVRDELYERCAWRFLRISLGSDLVRCEKPRTRFRLSESQSELGHVERAGEMQMDDGVFTLYGIG